MAIRIGRRGLTGWVGIGVAVLVVAGVTLAGCAGSAAAEIDYVVDGPLSSYNPNTVVGAASAGAQAFARTLVGFSYHGPTGKPSPTAISAPSRWSAAPRWCWTTRSPTTPSTPTASR
ncbi:bacterial extracellular solute-binding, family 5 domain protein [Mycobacterium avium subsp. avium 2285 (R)]|nr:bacterial extracellular solute-binding, family 5 domain protein [Mycobacterium avium subsp. avium 2285 (R)]